MTVTPSTPFSPITSHARVNAKTTSDRKSPSHKRHASKTTPPPYRDLVTPVKEPQPSSDVVPSAPAAQSPSPRSTSDATTRPVTKRTPVAAQPSPTETSVVILDWDDTLLSSSYLASLGYRLEVQQEFPPKLRQDLDLIEAHCIRVLENLIEMVGAENLVIITNAERGWVELSAKKFIPGVLPTLEKCHVVSARSTFEISGSGPFEWKMLAFYHKIQQSFGFRIQPPPLDPRSPYVSYLKHLFETGADPTELASAMAGQLPEHPSFERQTNFKQIPGLLSGDGTDEESSSDDSDDSVSVLPGGGHSHPDKENSSDSASAKAPRSMLLDDQEAYQTESNDSLEGQTDRQYAFGPIQPYHLHDANLVFQLHEEHEKIVQQTKYVVSFGDSLAEKHAAYGVVQNMPNTTLKTIKFLERPSTRQLIEQLSLVEQYLDYILECRRPLDIVLQTECDY